MTDTFFGPWGLPAYIDMGSLSNRIGLMFNEDKTDLSELARAARNTQWSDFSRSEKSRLQTELAKVLNQHIFGLENLEARAQSSATPFVSINYSNKSDTYEFALSVVEALLSGNCEDSQVHVESWAIGTLIEKMSTEKKSALMKDMIDLVASVSSEDNQKELIEELGVDNGATLTSSVVMSEDLGYADVMKEQRDKNSVRRSGFVPVPALF